MIAHGPTGCAHRLGSTTGNPHSPPSSQFHHDPIDTDDITAVANIGTPGDISVFLATFRNGINSQPWGSEIDPSMVEFVTIPGFSGILVFYGTRYVGIAHVDDRVSPPRVTLTDILESFRRMVATMVGSVSL